MIAEREIDIIIRRQPAKIAYSLLNGTQDRLVWYFTQGADVQLKLSITKEEDRVIDTICLRDFREWRAEWIAQKDEFRNRQRYAGRYGAPVLVGSPSWM